MRTHYTEHTISVLHDTICWCILTADSVFNFDWAGGCFERGGLTESESGQISFHESTVNQVSK